MKTSLIIIISTAIVLTLTDYFSEYKVPTSILKALESGNSKELCFFLNQSVDLTINNRNGVYNKVQAQMIISDFFENNEPAKLEIIQQNEQTHSSFAVCKMTCNNSKEYNVYISVRNIEEKTLITQLKIENFTK